MKYKWRGEVYNDVYALADDYCETIDCCGACRFEECPVHFREGDEAAIKNFIDGIGACAVSEEKEVNEGMESGFGSLKFDVKMKSGEPSKSDYYLAFVVDSKLNGYWGVVLWDNGWYNDVTVLCWSELPKLDIAWTLYKKG